MKLKLFKLLYHQSNYACMLSGFVVISPFQKNHVTVRRIFGIVIFLKDMTYLSVLGKDGRPQNYGAVYLVPANVIVVSWKIRINKPKLRWLFLFVFYCEQQRTSANNFKELSTPYDLLQIWMLGNFGKD